MRRRICAVAALVGMAWAASGAAGLEFRVVDGAGEGVPGAEIEVRGFPKAEGVLGELLSFRNRATTDEHGSADMPLPTIGGLLVIVDQPGFVPVARELACTAGKCRLDLQEGHPVVGRVLLADGARAVGTVCASWRDSFPRWGVEKAWRRCTDFGEEGRYRITGVFGNALERAAGSQVEYEIAAPGYLPATIHASSTTIADVVLERGLLFRGRVVSAASGQPLAGVSVRENRRPSARAVTDEAGKFELAVHSAENGLVAESKLHYPRTFVPPAKETENELEIRLDPREAVTGLVVVTGAEPVEHVKLFFERQMDGHTNSGHRRAVLDRLGRFVIPLPSAGRYGLRLWADDLEANAREPVQVTPGQLLDLGVIELEPGARIAGRIAREGDETNSGVSGAEILIVDEGVGLLQGLRQRGAEYEISDGNGEFEFTGLSAGAFQLRIRHKDHGTRLERVTLGAGESVDLGTVWLEPGNNVHGRVTDRKGEGQGGVRVEFLDREQAVDLPVASATTGSDGRFRGISVHSGTYRIRVKGRRLLASQTITVTEGREPQEIQVTTNGVDLSGRVVRNGIPVEGGWLALSSALDPGHFQGKVVVHHSGRSTSYGVPESDLTTGVGSNGLFRMEDAPAGLCWATFTDAAGRRVRRQLQIPDAAEAVVEIDVAGAVLSGHVIDAASGKGVAGALVKLVQSGAGLEAASATTRTDGQFSLADLEAGAYTLQVAAEHYEAGAVNEVNVRSGAPPIMIPLRRGPSKRLVVDVRRDFGAPAAGVMLTLLDAAGLPAASLATDSTGRREFGRLRPGRYRVAWSDALAGAGISGLIDLAGEEKTRFHTETLSNGASLTVICSATECFGAGIDYLALYSAEGFEIAPYLSGVSAAMRFSESGELALGRLSPGHYLLRVGAGGREWRYPVEASHGTVSVRLH